MLGDGRRREEAADAGAHAVDASARSSLRPASRRWHAKCIPRKDGTQDQHRRNAMYWGGGIIGLILLILLILLLTGNL
jgi:hypothetical protein